MNPNAQPAPLNNATPSDAPAETVSRTQRIGHYVLLAAWVINTAILISAFVWAYFDGRSLQALDYFQVAFAKVWNASLQKIVATWINKPLMAILTAATAAAIVTSLLMFGGLVFGAARFRSLRVWMAFTGVTAGWLAFIVAWPDVYWIGQQHRLRPMLASAETVARSLQANWPSEDGNLPEIGPFLAYPTGAPTTIMPLKRAAFPASNLRFSAIERTADGAIRFQLAGSEAGAWLEWRENDRVPEPFKSGLETQYNVSRYDRLAPQWFLVRYRAGSIGTL